MDTVNLTLVAASSIIAAVTAFGATMYELWQSSSKEGRWPWRSEQESAAGDLTRPPQGFWWCSNVGLRMLATAVLAGTLAGAGWIADAKAGIAVGLTGALSLSSLAGAKDTGVVPATPAQPAEGEI
ncbi:hypothetical protein AW168_31065 [Nocardia brasiliensis]|uniref:Uncharacterized protein n=1 Tax=Nocardia brasiliensis (strain ATCC 700358 / HUJEG-1) TaxID=1133849 RepID=K0ERX6_NOCB7|nr:hypothetical protein O3I_023065 [Nocardia brasiliensis ATCC 700358]OCF86520.1 hypothetical protein AW168_31065 [Nocardia brasiliensis]